jgi:hypothetical protein
MSALWRACGRSGLGTLNGDLRRVLRGERQSNTSAYMVHRIARRPCAVLEPLHAPDQQARLI